MTEILTISDCVRRLEAGEVATLEVYTYDAQRKRGGKIEQMTCQILRGEQEDGVSAGIATQNPKPETQNPKRKFYIRKVRIIADGHPTAVIRTIHPPLIRSFNGVKTLP